LLPFLLGIYKMLGRLAGNLAGTFGGTALGGKAGSAIGTTIGLAAGGPVGAAVGGALGTAIGGFTGGTIGGDIGKEVLGKKRMAGDFIQIDGGEKIPRSVVESTPQGQALIKALEIQQLTGGAPLSFDMGKLNPNTQSLGNKFSNFQQNNRNTLAAAMGLPTGFFG